MKSFLKKSVLSLLGLFFSLTLTSSVFAEEPVLTPEKVSGIWEGKCANPETGVQYYWKFIFKGSTLNGVILADMGARKTTFWMDGPGRIEGKHLIIGDKKFPDREKIHFVLREDGMMDGVGHNQYSETKFWDFKKRRSLTPEEENFSFQQLEKLWK